MVPGSRPDPWQRAPLFDVHPRTGISIEVFFADRAMETFGRCGAGWFWGRAGAAVHQTVRRPVRLLQATQRIGTR